MPLHSPTWLRSPCVSRSVDRVRFFALLGFALVLCVCRSETHAQYDRGGYLEAKPLATANVQPISAPKTEEYANPNQLMMYQPLSEDPLSFYVRTQDGEWQIPTQVDADDPWVRLLVLGPVRPTIADVSIDINRQPFRAAREQWIDKLLAEAKATYLVRTGAAAADAAGIAEEMPESESDVPTELAAEDSDGASSEAADDKADDTESDDPVNDGETEADSESDEAEPSSGEDIPMVKAQSRQTSSLFKRLINYLAADQATPQREEVRWLLAEWTGGPALLTLSPAFAWRRADAAPLWHALDLDGDQLLSSAEIDQVAATLKKADINRDEIVDLVELDRLSRQHASQQRTNGYPLIVVIDENTDWAALRRHLRTAYQAAESTGGDLPLLDRIAQGDRSISTRDLANLLSSTPDLVYRVTFESEDAHVVLLATTEADASAGGAVSAEQPSEVTWDYHSATKQAITVERHGTYMELTAAQGEIDKENASGDMQQTQVSIGAVVDGFPLFRLLDHDNNRQLTLRERRSIGEFLRGLDSNSDGNVDRSEVPTAIRLAVTHGPQAHVHLANAVAAQREHEGATPVEAPDWFVGMDRNRDGDLSRREFQGSPRQFAKYDQDSDGLISLSEVQKSVSKK